MRVLITLILLSISNATILKDKLLGYESICSGQETFKNELVQLGNVQQAEGFCSFVRKHGKVYDNIVELRRRYSIFNENFKLAEKMTNDDESAIYSAVHSPFGDLSTKEFKETVLFSSVSGGKTRTLSEMLDDQKPTGILQKLKERKAFRTASDENSAESADNFDWVEEGKLTPVKSQGSLGTCWAFSAVTVVESQVAIKQDRLVNLSVEQLVECANEVNSSTGEADCAEFGGWPYLGFEYMNDFGGLYLDDDFPYCSGLVDPRTRLPLCFPCMPKSYDTTYCGDHSDMYCNVSSTRGQVPDGLCSKNPGKELVKLSSWEKLSSDEDELKKSLKEKGPISVAMSAMILQFYFSGVITLPLCSSSKSGLDHAVVLVGYGETETIFGNDLPFWKVRNSWGASWGEKGYFRLKRGVGMCGINLAPSIAFV